MYAPGERLTRLRREAGAEYGGSNGGEVGVGGRGLHSSIFWLKVSAFCRIGSACRGWFEGD